MKDDDDKYSDDNDKDYDDDDKDGDGAGAGAGDNLCKDEIVNVGEIVARQADALKLALSCQHLISIM